MIDPQQLLEIARELARTKGRGRPRSGALRRSVSTSYYALFHFLSISTSDLLVGRRYRGTLRYLLVYRSFEHGRMRDVCKRVLDGKLLFPPGVAVSELPFTDGILHCASAFVELQGNRHDADYDPSASVTSSDAIAAVNRASEGMLSLQDAYEPERKLFLTLLLYKPR